MVTVSTCWSTRALSVDIALTRLLTQGTTRARVHSVFRHVINVVTPAGQLISLCGRDHDDAPWSLRADVDDWTEWGVQTGVMVQATHDGLTFPVGGPGISLTGAQAWDAAATPMTANPTQLIARANELAGVICAAGIPGGALSGPAPDPFGALVGERIRKGLADIAAGDLAGHANDVEAAASSLLGLGPGLTPAGDDVLTGLALVVARPGSRATTVLPALRRVLQHHADRTTALSSATLSAALDGRGRQRLLDLVDTLVSRDDTEAALLRVHAELVLGIGHTSGTDIACGVLAGIELEIQRRGFA
ncbi:MAG: DUF2877 domain-containing protein [Actinomycetota bacterium]|nr:DUF2877 domain-containing protein [Actinomycetota bacterium]